MSDMALVRSRLTAAEARAIEMVLDGFDQRQLLFSIALPQHLCY